MNKENMVKCTRCRNIHKEGERVEVRDKSYKGIKVFTLVCPRCGCKNFYDLSKEANKQ